MPRNSATSLHLLTMRRSKCEIYMHFVWTTWKRHAWVLPEIEREIYRGIESEVRKQRAVVLALNGMPDHIHLIAQMPTTLSPADLMKQAKGVSSAFINDHCEIEERFRWQENYGVFTLSRSHLSRAVRYVQNQKEHHASGNVWEQWEEDGEEVPDS